MGKSFTAVAICYAVVVALAAIGFDLAEAKFGIMDSLWWAFTTATTTGYGDMYPVTTTGRAIAIFLMHFGPGFAFPVMTALMSAKLIVDSDAFTHDEQEAIKTKLDHIESLIMSGRAEQPPRE
jgi:voltage-gated potassium channel Kch